MADNVEPDNIIAFPGTFVITEEDLELNMSSEGVANGIIENNLSEVYVVGLDPEGELYLASNVPSLSKFVYYLELAKLRLLNGTT